MDCIVFLLLQRPPGHSLFLLAVFIAVAAMHRNERDDAPIGETHFSGE